MSGKKSWPSVTVKISKQYTYPIGVLKRQTRDEDAVVKAQADLSEEINSAINEQRQIPIFDFEIIPPQFAEIARRIPAPTIEALDTSIRSVNTFNVANTIARTLTEDKYGYLTFEENPNIFSVEERRIPTLRADGVTELQVEYVTFFNEEVEEYLRRMEHLVYTTINNSI